MLRLVPAHDPRAVRRSAGETAVSLLLLGLPLVAGCPDSEAKFNEFLDETKDDRDFMPPPPPDVEGTADISGQFHLAISTVIAPDLPLQFIATNTLTDDGSGGKLLKSCLQPLQLDQGKVTTPRGPVGDPICYEGIPVVDGKFTIEAGVVMVTGMANPVTGGDIESTLTLVGTIISADFYCGDITGAVMSPLQADLAGSTFAAVRLTDPMMLPLDVAKNCQGVTVTDK